MHEHDEQHDHPATFPLGSRVRLTYGDGSTVDGTWVRTADGTEQLRRDDGRTHTHVTGQVRRELLALPGGRDVEPASPHLLAWVDRLTGSAPVPVPGGRDGVRRQLQETLRHLQDVGMTATTAAHFASSPGWRHTWSGRRGADWSREQLTRALDDLTKLTAAAAAAAAVTAQLRDLYPAAHGDDPEHEGRCACGRWAERCPARAALERGEQLWEAPDGRVYDVVDGGEAADR